MQTSRPALIVSIHDVSPLTRARVAEMLDDLSGAGAPRTSLLVIPNHHHKAPLAEDAAFGAWLRMMAAAGQEIVQHGYYHQGKGPGSGASAEKSAAEPGPPGWRRWKRKLITEYYTAGEGEFFDLTEGEAARRLKRAKGEFAAAGLFPKGFIAPAWLLGREAEKAVREAGFDYTTRLKTFKDLVSGRETFSQSLVWSVRAAWRRLASLGWNAFLNRRLRDNGLLRISLHPPDWNHAAVRAQILRFISAALASRHAMTYEGWLRRERQMDAGK